MTAPLADVGVYPRRVVLPILVVHGVETGLCSSKKIVEKLCRYSLVSTVSVALPERQPP